MEYSIVEIGTSDFRTTAGDFEEHGLYIEPVKLYFDRLPECKKVNCAISNYEGKEYIYYIPLELIENKELNLPNWLRGCNSFGKIHPTILKNGWEKYVQKDVIDVRRIKDVLDEYDVTDINILKIDTEGHDVIILKDFLNTVNFLPEVIIFEANELGNPYQIEKMVERLTKLGYKCKKQKADYHCLLKTQKLKFI